MLKRKKWIKFDKVIIGLEWIDTQRKTIREKCFASLVRRDLLLKEKNLFLKSKFFHLEFSLFLKGLGSYRSKSYLSSKKMVENVSGVLISVKAKEIKKYLFIALTLAMLTPR